MAAAAFPEPMAKRPLSSTRILSPRESTLLSAPSPRAVAVGDIDVGAALGGKTTWGGPAGGCWGCHQWCWKNCRPRGAVWAVAVLGVFRGVPGKSGPPGPPEGPRPLLKLAGPAGLPGRDHSAHGGVRSRGEGGVRSVGFQREPPRPKAAIAWSRGSRRLRPRRPSRTSACPC